MTSADITMSLSASGSRNFPITVTSPCLARHPAVEEVGRAGHRVDASPAMKLFTRDSYVGEVRGTPGSSRSARA